MKIALAGISGINIGKHSLKDPRFELADSLVEATRKVYAQVDVVGEDQVLDADAILTSAEAKLDVILNDLELVETRLGRGPQPAERAVLEALQRSLERETFIRDAGLSAEELQTIAAHPFQTIRPICLATSEEVDAPEALLVRAFREAGYICFLTVGGKENRAWPIRQGVTAWEAAGSIHTDLQKGFIRAEVIEFDDFVAAGGEIQAKRAGKQRLEPKQYVIQDYDLVTFRFSK
jgi:Protein of unknown function (DUF933)